MDLITLREASEKSGFTIAHLSDMCRKGRINGAVRAMYSNFWVLPDNFKITPVKLGRPTKGAKS